MGSTMSVAQEELIRKHFAPGTQVIIALDENEAGQAGREDIASRLVRFYFVKIQTFKEPDTQPEDLNAKEVQKLVGGVL